MTASLFGMCGICAVPALLSTGQAPALSVALGKSIVIERGGGLVETYVLTLFFSWCICCCTFHLYPLVHAGICSWFDCLWRYQEHRATKKTTTWDPGPRHVARYRNMDFLRPEKGTKHVAVSTLGYLGSKGNALEMGKEEVYSGTQHYGRRPLFETTGFLPAQD